MPFIETVSEVVEWIADQAGIYGDPRCKPTENDIAHIDNCTCRQFWTDHVERRLRQALVNEAMLRKEAV